jgi:hypothetical protein
MLYEMNAKIIRKRMWQHKPASDTPITEERETTFPEIGVLERRLRFDLACWPKGIRTAGIGAKASLDTHRGMVRSRPQSSYSLIERPAALPAPNASFATTPANCRVGWKSVIQEFSQTLPHLVMWSGRGSHYFDQLQEIIDHIAALDEFKSGFGYVLFRVAVETRPIRRGDPLLSDPRDDPPDDPARPRRRKPIATGRA